MEGLNNCLFLLNYSVDEAMKMSVFLLKWIEERPRQDQTPQRKMMLRDMLCAF